MENSSRIKSAEYARQAVAMIARNRKADVRAKMAALALERGNYDAGGKAIWRAYIDADCPPSCLWA